MIRPATRLVLSIFPGIDLLGRAFEEEGYCVVRGPDVIWGGDILTFHPPPGVFEGVIGGDPCQEHSPLAHIVRHMGNQPRFPDMTPEYVRVVEEVQPRWFVRENVPQAPLPKPAGYDLWTILLVDFHVGGLQPRKRRICFGMREGLWPDMLSSPLALIEYTEASPSTPTCLAGHGPLFGQRQRSAAWDIEDACEAMGLPRDFTEHMPFTMHGKRSLIGNGVPMAMGRAIARAVKKATS